MLEPEQQGRVLSSFFLGYLLTQVAGGWLADRYGGKRVLGFGVIFWSCFLLTPAAALGGMTALLITRVLMGVGGGVTFPSVYALFGHWIPVRERSRTVGILFSMIPLGSVFALVATPPLVERFGWASAFYLFGAVGFLWWFCLATGGRQNPWGCLRLDPAERAYIEAHLGTDASAASPTLKAMLAQPAIWAIVVCHFCANWGTYVLLAWMPTYINKGLGVDFASVGIFRHDSLPLFLPGPERRGSPGRSAPGLGDGDHASPQTHAKHWFWRLGLVLAGVGYVESIPWPSRSCPWNIFGGATAGGFGVNHLDIAPERGHYHGSLEHRGDPSGDHRCLYQWPFAGVDR